MSSSVLQFSRNLGSRVSSLDLNKPYSFSRNPRAMARLRITMLCSLLPVKYANALAYSESATTRRSAWMPPASSTLALVPPAASTLKFPSRPVKYSMMRSDFFADTKKSTSPITSLLRRKLPAVLQRITSGCARSSSRIGSATDSPMCR